ncbi:hypothetical protein PVNG_06273 [Plasmodium vivax North Korean]|uniref:Fam-l protein n=1 Tax=Plasmodium vivax North Korean TaxID=1035514 RepID=A0A0J9TK96_PLAVI|nr:hypothetical protein PVNG_06273 [Plasmodium vivax North Korean]
MGLLKKPYMCHILKIPFFTKILVFALLSWIYQYNYNNCTIVKSLENGRRIGTCLGRNTNRLLAKHRDEGELERIRLRNKANDNVYKCKLSNGNESSNIYGHLKQDKLNNVDTYLKNYKSRYAKKKGLKKFDCYYEKKLFSSINKLEKHMGKNNLSKNRIKGVLFIKYGYTVQKGGETFIGLRAKITTDDASLHCIFLCISITIILSLIIYTYIKILKYKRIKAGMLK